MSILLHPTTAHEAAHLIENPAHAVGIFGQDGAGKSYLAEYIAREVLNTADLSTSAVVHRIHAGDGIAQVRALRTFLSLKTVGRASIRRVVIIEQADLLGKDAQNALLKTLEEPPTDTLILLTAAQTSHLLPTIMSRIRSVRIMPLTKAQCMELGTYDIETLQKAYNLSGGHAGLFMGLLETGSEHHMNLAVQLAKDFLSQTPYTRLAQLESISKDKEKSRHLVVGLQLCLHAALRTAQTNVVASLHKKLEYVGQAERRLNHSVQPKLVLTTLATQL